jgi:hypothetical protein
MYDGTPQTLSPDTTAGTWQPGVTTNVAFPTVQVEGRNLATVERELIRARLRQQGLSVIFIDRYDLDPWIPDQFRYPDPVRLVAENPVFRGNQEDTRDPNKFDCGYWRLPWPIRRLPTTTASSSSCSAPDKRALSFRRFRTKRPECFVRGSCSKRSWRPLPRWGSR